MAVAAQQPCRAVELRRARQRELLELLLVHAHSRWLGGVTPYDAPPARKSHSRIRQCATPADTTFTDRTPGAVSAGAMPQKRKAFVHIGLDDGAGDFIDGALERHAGALAELGVRCPAESAEELFRAAVEILRMHPEWGYKRREVEGAWADVVRAGLKGRETLVVSQTLLAGARPSRRRCSSTPCAASRCTSSSPRRLPTPGPCPASRPTTSARCSSAGRASSRRPSGCT